mmetsp:Transcript_8885/g.13196  ORF Transcript_8885/g.13196 Transcript_8885/m.13196 type:complete len:716 (+) Transcript_8885:17-2164(+)
MKNTRKALKPWGLTEEEEVLKKDENKEREQRELEMKRMIRRAKKMNEETRKILERGAENQKESSEIVKTLTTKTKEAQQVIETIMNNMANTIQKFKKERMTLKGHLQTKPTRLYENYVEELEKHIFQLMTTVNELSTKNNEMAKKLTIVNKHMVEKDERLVFLSKREDMGVTKLRKRITELQKALKNQRPNLIHYLHEEIIGKPYSTKELDRRLQEKIKTLENQEPYERNGSQKNTLEKRDQKLLEESMGLMDHGTKLQAYMKQMETWTDDHRKNIESMIEGILGYIKRQRELLYVPQDADLMTWIDEGTIHKNDIIDSPRLLQQQQQQDLTNKKQYKNRKVSYKEQEIHHQFTEPHQEMNHQFIEKNKQDNDKMNQLTEHKTLTLLMDESSKQSQKLAILTHQGTQTTEPHTFKRVNVDSHMDISIRSTINRKLVKEEEKKHHQKITISDEIEHFDYLDPQVIENSTSLDDLKFAIRELRKDLSLQSNQLIKQAEAAKSEYVYMQELKERNAALQKQLEREQQKQEQKERATLDTLKAEHELLQTNDHQHRQHAVIQTLKTKHDKLVLKNDKLKQKLAKHEHTMNTMQRDNTTLRQRLAKKQRNASLMHSKSQLENKLQRLLRERKEWQQNETAYLQTIKNLQKSLIVSKNNLDIKQQQLDNTSQQLYNTSSLLSKRMESFMIQQPENTSLPPMTTSGRRKRPATQARRRRLYK